MSTDFGLWHYRARVVRILDGDTLELDVDLGFDIAVRPIIRLAGIDAPELSTPEGQDAARKLASYIGDVVATARANEWPFWLQTERIGNDDHEQMSFARYVGTVWSGQTNLADWMLAQGAAKVYPS